MVKRTTSGSRRARSLQLESLENRLQFDGAATSAAAGLPWSELGSLTYSFALDGTAIGASHNRLFQTLGQAGTPEQWQSEFRAAFDSWLAPLNAHIREVSDSGVPFGSYGPTQGDSRFGDIRIGAVPLSGNVMAEAIPHSMMVQGAWAGDILLNSNLPWRDLQQVFAVALHEFGHVLGIDHSDDVQSPMYFDGVYSALAPTSSDIAELRKLYSGVRVDVEDDGEEGPHSGSNSEWGEEPNFSFDPSLAIPLEGVLANSARYLASGEITSANPQQYFKLLPIGEIDHAAFLNVVVSSADLNGLIPKIRVYDSSGDRVSIKVLHNSSGNLVIQAKDVEPNHFYYVAISPAAAPLENQQGKFTLIAEYGNTQLNATLIGKYNLKASSPIVEQSFRVNTSRLIHVLVTAVAPSSTGVSTALWGTLVDGQNRIVGQVAMRGSDSRSMEMVFLEPGDYKLILEIGNQDLSLPSPMSVSLYIDELSIDVGPGVMDPLLRPQTDLPGSNPVTGTPIPPIVLVNGPVFPVPSSLPPVPVYPSIPPWNSVTLHYWPTTSLVGLQSNPLLPLDVSGDSLISPLDVLLVINALNLATNNASQYAPQGSFLDTNSDGYLTPMDALGVLNHLNRRGGEGEGFFYLDATDEPSVKKKRSSGVTRS